MTDIRNDPERRKRVEDHMRARAETLIELLTMDGVPADYQTGICLMLVSMDIIIKEKGKEHLARVMRQWADNVIAGRAVR